MTRFSELPKDEQPAERLLTKGAGSLSDAELIAVVIGAQTMAQPHDMIRDGLPAFAGYDWCVGGRHRIPRTKAAKIAAALELGRRIAANSPRDGHAITSPDDLAPGLIARYSHRVQEHFVCIFLDSRHVVLTERVIFVGTINSALVSAREPVRMALEIHATAMIAAHQHPSGDPSPSEEDVLFTRRLSDACKTVGVDLLDHLVISVNRYVSMKQRGLFW